MVHSDPAQTSTRLPTATTSNSYPIYGDRLSVGTRLFQVHEALVTLLNGGHAVW